MRVLVARLGWSSFGWRGLPANPNATEKKRHSEDVEKATMSYVRDNRYGHEWWNFDEEFCEHFDISGCSNDRYYGTVPKNIWGIRKNLRNELRDDESLIFFISRDLKDYQMKLVGIYCHATYLGKREVPPKNSYKEALATNLGVNIEEVDLVFSAPKEHSLVFPENAMEGINQNKLFGAVITNRLDVEDITETANYDELINILSGIRKKLAPKDQAKLDHVMEILREIKEQVPRKVKEVPQGKRISFESGSISNSAECTMALCNIAKILGFICKPQYPKGGYRVDAVWKKVKEGEPFIVFEIMDKGDAHKDVSSLKDISTKIIPGAKPVWIVRTDRLDEAQRILEKRFLAEKIALMSFDDVGKILAYLQKLHELLSGYGLEMLLRHDE